MQANHKSVFLRKLFFTRRAHLLSLAFISVVLTHGVYVTAQTPQITMSAGLPVGTACKTMTFGGGKYISLFSQGLYSSADGETWNKVDYPGFNGSQFNSIAYGSGKFVMVGKNGQILTSEDGLSWSAATSGTAHQLYDVQFIEGKFYSVGLNRTLIESSDGITWNAITINAGTATDLLRNITKGPAGFVISATRSNSTGKFAYSSASGASNTWAFTDVAFATANKVIYLKDRYYFFGTAGVYTSVNGATWVNSTASLTVELPDGSMQNLGSPNQVFHGIYDDSRVILFGSSQYYGTHGCVFTSTNGTNFKLEPKSAYLTAHGSLYVNDKYFLYGSEGIISSDDGINYHYPGGSFSSLATNGVNYVGVGALGSAGIIFSSGNFDSWTERTPAGQRELYSVVYNGSKFAAAGSKTFLESMDGITWSSVGTQTDEIYCLAYGDGKYVTSGYDGGTWEFRISYSANGSTWTTAFSDPYYIYRIRFVNGNFFALGYDEMNYVGAILYSPDGVTWTDITPSLSFPVVYFSDVVFDGSRYHFMGVQYTDDINWEYGEFFSVSTASVSDPASYVNKGVITTAHPGILLGGTFGEGCFAFNNGKFVGSVVDNLSGEAYVIYSEDGVNWNAEATGHTSMIGGVEAIGETFRLLGAADLRITVEFENSTLPVSLMNFDAIADGERALLKWSTSSEINSGRFQVQHSLDGQSWSLIGEVVAAGNSNFISNYEFTHQSPAPGNNYYRLTEVDLNGRRQVSPVRKVWIGEQNLVRISPNPTRNIITVDLKYPAILMVLNASGQVMGSWRLSTGANPVQLDKYPAGIYHLVVDTNGQKKSYRIVKQ